jgi:hypothetical protein
LLGTIAYNSYVIYDSLQGNAACHAGLSGLVRTLKGNVAAFGAGCLASSLLAPLGFAVPSGTGAVYGGRAFQAARAAAEAAAAETEGGLNLLQNTIGGQIAENLAAGAPQSLQSWIFDYASAQFANGLEGSVQVFQGSFGELGQFAAQQGQVRRAIVDSLPQADKARTLSEIRTLMTTATGVRENIEVLARSNSEPIRTDRRGR